MSIRGFSDVIFTLVSYLPPCPTDLVLSHVRNLGKTLAKICTELQPSIFIFFDRGYNFHRNIDKDPNYNHIVILLYTVMAQH